MHGLVAYNMHLRTSVKPLPKCGRLVTDEMQPNTHDYFVKWSVLGPWRQYTSSRGDSFKLGTLVFVSVGCNRMLSIPLNNVLVTMRHVTTRINGELRIGISPFANRSTHNSTKRRAKMM